MTQHNLREYQERAIQDLRAQLAAGIKRIVLQIPTGGGKTAVAGSIIRSALGKRKRAIFTVPALSLITQTIDSFKRDGITGIGVMQGRHELTNHAAPVQICSVQTLARRFIPEADVVIVDECHVVYDVYNRWFTDPAWENIPIIGLSATPWTKGLGKLYKSLVIGTTTQQLIDEKYLAPFRVFAPSHVDLKGVKTIAGDYDLEGLDKAMNTAKLTADIVETWIEKGEDRPTLCFAVNRAHAQNICDAFNKAGVPAAYVDGETPLDERDDLAIDFKAGKYKIICNVGVMTTGVDLPFVSCLILARPTKSEMLYCQIIGRGLRLYEGKENCIERGSKILTNKGLVNIEHITLDHLVWDGVSFVEHKGAICRGVQSVISYCGITATPDHKVMTNEGWKTIEEANRRQLWVAVTGSSGSEIRFNDDNFSENYWVFGSSKGGSYMRALSKNAYGSVSQYEKKTENKILPSLQFEEKNICSEVALSKMPSTTGSLSQSIKSCVREIRGAWNKIQFFITERCRSLGCAEPWYSIAGNAIGSYRQQRALRAEQFAMGRFCFEPEQYTEKSWFKAKIYKFQKIVSRNKICRFDVTRIYTSRFDGRSNYKSVESAVVQTEREVWDILDAGPLRRFTANGRLVHNCIILDHSDTTQRLGFVTDIIHTELDIGRKKDGGTQKERDEPLPKECPKCTYLRPARMKVCPNCGFEAKPQANVFNADGTLSEVTGRGASKTWGDGLTPFEQRELFYRELLGIAAERGYKSGWAFHQYKSKYKDVPDKTFRTTPVTPSQKTLGWLKHSWIKQRAVEAKRRGQFSHAEFAK